MGGFPRILDKFILDTDQPHKSCGIPIGVGGNSGAVRFPCQIAQCITGVVSVSDIFAVDLDRSLDRESGRIRKGDRRTGYGKICSDGCSRCLKVSGACENDRGNGIIDRGIKGREGIRSRSATP